MGESLVEYLVKGKTKGWQKGLSVFLYVITALALILFFLSSSFWLFLIAGACGAGGYFLNLYAEVEYEYLYFDKELSIDKIIGKSKRTQVGVYELGKIEIMAPIKSYHLDNYKNRQVAVQDFSIGVEEQPDLRYCFYYEGGKKVIISPNEELVKLMKNNAPRKIFND